MTPEFTPSPIVRTAATPPRRNQGMLWLILPGGVLACIAVTAIGILAYLLHDSGYLHMRDGFRVDGKALRAYVEARRLKPESHLVLETRSSFVGPDMYTDIYIGSNFDPQEHVKLEVRGVTLVMSRYFYDLRTLDPVITHDGRQDKLTGYQVYYRH